MTAPPMTARLAGLSDLLARATARPWRVFDSPYGNDVIAIMKGNSPPRNEKGHLVRRWLEIVAWPGFDDSDVPKRYRRANAELIVAAVNALPDLLARIAALESALEPFAREAATFCTDLPDDTAAGEVDFLTLGDFRRAALTLNKDTTNAEG